MNKREMINRAIEIIDTLEETKPLYAELDQITQKLVDAGFSSEGGLALVDKFEAKNTAWKSAAFRRFELEKVAVQVKAKPKASVQPLVKKPKPQQLEIFRVRKSRGDK